MAYGDFPFGDGTFGGLAEGDAFQSSSSSMSQSSASSPSSASSLSPSSQSSLSSLSPSSPSTVTQSPSTSSSGWGVGLVSFWPLDEGPTELATLHDVVGGRDIACTPALDQEAGVDDADPFDNWVSGRKPLQWAFRANTQTHYYVTDHREFVFPASGLPVGGDSRSLALWYFHNATDGLSTLFSYGTYGSLTEFSFSVWPGASYALMFRVSQTSFPNTYSRTLAKGWHHIVLNFASGTATLYVDGTIWGSLALALNTATATNGYLGSNTGTEGTFDKSFNVNVVVDNIRLYNRELAAWEITGLATGDAPSSNTSSSSGDLAADDTSSSSSSNTSSSSTFAEGSSSSDTNSSNSPSSASPSSQSPSSDDLSTASTVNDTLSTASTASTNSSSSPSTQSSNSSSSSSNTSSSSTSDTQSSASLISPQTLSSFSTQTVVLDLSSVSSGEDTQIIAGASSPSIYGDSYDYAAWTQFNINSVFGVSNKKIRRLRFNIAQFTTYTYGGSYPWELVLTSPVSGDTVIADYTDFPVDDTYYNVEVEAPDVIGENTDGDWIIRLRVPGYPGSTGWVYASSDSALSLTLNYEEQELSSVSERSSATESTESSSTVGDTASTVSSTSSTVGDTLSSVSTTTDQTTSSSGDNAADITTSSTSSTSSTVADTPSSRSSTSQSTSSSSRDEQTTSSQSPSSVSSASSESPSSPSSNSPSSASPSSNSPSSPSSKSRTESSWSSADDGYVNLRLDAGAERVLTISGDAEDFSSESSQWFFYANAPFVRLKFTAPADGDYTFVIRPTTPVTAVADGFDIRFFYDPSTYVDRLEYFYFTYGGQPQRSVTEYMYAGQTIYITVSRLGTSSSVLTQPFTVSALSGVVLSTSSTESFTSDSSDTTSDTESSSSSSSSSETSELSSNSSSSDAAVNSTSSVSDTLSSLSSPVSQSSQSLQSDSSRTVSDVTASSPSSPRSASSPSSVTPSSRSSQSPSSPSITSLSSPSSASTNSSASSITPSQSSFSPLSPSSATTRSLSSGSSSSSSSESTPSSQSEYVPYYFEDQYVHDWQHAGEDAGYPFARLYSQSDLDVAKYVVDAQLYIAQAYTGAEIALTQATSPASGGLRVAITADGTEIVSIADAPVSATAFGDYTVITFAKNDNRLVVVVDPRRAFASDYSGFLPFAPNVVSYASRLLVDAVIANAQEVVGPGQTLSLAAGSHVSLGLDYTAAGDAVITVSAAYAPSGPCVPRTLKKPRAAVSLGTAVPNSVGDVKIVGCGTMLVNTDGGGLSISSMAKPCCDCDDYAAAFLAVKKAHDRIVGVKDWLDDVTDKYSSDLRLLKFWTRTPAIGEECGS